MYYPMAQLAGGQAEPSFLADAGTTQDILPEHWAQHPWLSPDFLPSCELPCSFPSSRPGRCFSVSPQPCLWPQPSPRRELNPDLNLFGHKLLGSPETTRL